MSLPHSPGGERRLRPRGCFAGALALASASGSGGCGVGTAEGVCVGGGGPGSAASRESGPPQRRALKPCAPEVLGLDSKLDVFSRHLSASALGMAAHGKSQGRAHRLAVWRAAGRHAACCCWHAGRSCPGLLPRRAAVLPSPWPACPSSHQLPLYLVPWGQRGAAWPRGGPHAHPRRHSTGCPWPMR